jgi:hypothetical protein
MWNRYPPATGVSWSTLAAASSDPASPAGGECEAQQCAIADVDHFLGPAGRNQGGEYIERHCFLGWTPPLLWNWWAMEIVDTPWVPSRCLIPASTSAWSTAASMVPEWSRMNLICASTGTG